MFVRGGRLGLALTPISGNGQKPSLFGSNLQQSRIFHATKNGLGQFAEAIAQIQPATANYEWATRARNAISKIDSLSSRVPAIANVAERTKVIGWFGDPASRGTPAYVWASVKADLEEAENFVPPNYNYSDEAKQIRIRTLEDLSHQYEMVIGTAEQNWGPAIPPPIVAVPPRVQEAPLEIVGPGEIWEPAPRVSAQPTQQAPSAKDQETLKTFMEEMRKTGKELLSQQPKSEFPVVPVVVGIGVLALAGLIVGLVK